MNPFQPIFDDAGFVILDGGLATHLEALGADLTGSLWSARLLIENPDLIRQAHLDFLEAGADCIISASYQATLPGLAAHGIDAEHASTLLKQSVRLAVEARDRFAASRIDDDRTAPLVAASIGPYGAWLANGAEYTGDYDVDDAALYEFHRERWHLLANTEADLLACETVPAIGEARAFARLLGETPNRYAWVSFTTRDGQTISDGSELQGAMAPLAALPNVAALGVNCSEPELMGTAIRTIRSFTDKPVLVYPNSGEQYDAPSQRWTGEAVDFGRDGQTWIEAGASIIGGCCRTTPAFTRALRLHVSARR